MSTDQDLLDEIVAEVVRVDGVVVKRNDPIMATVLLNKAILQRYMAQMEQAFAKAVKRAQQDLTVHAQEQANYVDQVMFKDREKFVTEQKASLDALDSRLRIRDAAVAKIMTDILEQASERFAAEVAVAANKPKEPQRQDNKEKKRAALGALALGIAVGAAGTMGTIIILLRLGVVGVVGAGQ